MKNNNYLIAQICRMHYLENLSQDEVSRSLRLSKSAISRLIKEGKDKGIITFHIKDFEGRLNSLEARIEKYFKLKEAVVVSDEGLISEESIKKKVAKSAAILLQRRIRKNDVIAVSWGTSLAELAKALDPPVNLNVEIVPLLGGIDVTGKNIHSNEIAREMSEAFRGKYYVMNAPVFVSNNKIKEAFEKEKNIEAVINKAKSADIALVGIGTSKKSSTMIKRGYFSFEEFSKLTCKGVIGDICTNFYNIRGDIIKTCFHNKMIGAGYEELKNIPTVIGVASGEDKKEAILGALRTGLVNIIVINKGVAEYLLNNIV